MSNDRQVWLTGIGLLSAVGEGRVAHERLLDPAHAAIGRADEASFHPYPVHCLAEMDFAAQIPKASEQRQMGRWQRIGVYAAGLALADAGIAGDADMLARTNLIVAAGNGERDTVLDESILAAQVVQSASPGALNTALAKGLRPTLYLGELSNLLAGNIQIVHHVTGSSRTFKGEEIAGLSAVENAVRRIEAGQGELFLVGGALNAERRDLLLTYELGRNLWRRPFEPVWQRHKAGGGFVPGSMGAFLVLEARAHAERRGARPWARIAAIASDRSRRQPGDARDALSMLFERISSRLPPGPLAVLSGASGVEPATSEELEFLFGLEGEGYHPTIRAWGTRLGNGVEAQLFTSLALGALALRKGCFYPPFDTSGVEEPDPGSPSRVLVTCAGHWRGEGLAIMESVGSGGAG